MGKLAGYNSNLTYECPIKTHLIEIRSFHGTNKPQDEKLRHYANKILERMSVDDFEESIDTLKTALKEIPPTFVELWSHIKRFAPVSRIDRFSGHNFEECDRPECNGGWVYANSREHKVQSYVFGCSCNKQTRIPVWGDRFMPTYLPEIKDKTSFDLVDYNQEHNSFIRNFGE